jgi:cytochrome c oxidase subunit I+III
VATLTTSEPRSEILSQIWRPLAGLIGWLSAVNHKNIGRRYIVTGFLFFVMAGIAALLMRTQLMYPENTVLHADQYNRLFSTHGIIMMFLFAVPIMLGVGIYFVPLMIGTRDVAFPKLNALGYYTYVMAGIVLWLSLFLGTSPDGGWFAYTPLTERRSIIYFIDYRLFCRLVSRDRSTQPADAGGSFTPPAARLG